MNGEDILIVGGYGEVGGRLAALLEKAYPGHVVTAGRNPPSAAGPRTRAVDIDEPNSIEAALHGVGTVVACVRQREPHLLRAVVRHGLAYTSCAPPLLPWSEVKTLDEQARHTGARVVLATGIEPGIASVLVRIAADTLGSVDTVETALLLSVGDAYGADSMGFILDEIIHPYTVTLDGRERTIHAFEQSKRIEFPAPLGMRRAYTMAFTDQHYYPMTLGARTAIARLALDPSWFAAAIAVVMKLGARTWLRHAGGRTAMHGLTEKMRSRYGQLDRFALVVEVRGGGRFVRASLAGRKQAQATAAGTYAVTAALFEREQEKAGVWLAEQVIDPKSFLQRLALQGLVPSIAAPRFLEERRDAGEVRRRSTEVTP